MCVWFLHTFVAPDPQADAQADAAASDATLPTLTEFTAETLASLVDLATPAGRLPDHALQSRALDTVAGWLPREGLPVEEIKRRALIAGVRV